MTHRMCALNLLAASLRAEALASTTRLMAGRVKTLSARHAVRTSSAWQTRLTSRRARSILLLLLGVVVVVVAVVAS